MSPVPLGSTDIEGRLLSRGKVRDIYSCEDALILVATDRISAFDRVLSPEIPGRGVILTQLSNFWFDVFSSVMPNHLRERDTTKFPAPFNAHRELQGRSVLVQRLRPIPVECVVRGYLAGSGWKEYLSDGAVCGIGLPEGLAECQQLPEPIFTPAAKNTTGHDENISFDRMVEITGADVAEKLRDLSLRLYREAAEYAASRGILIADTKFEFGLDHSGDIVWMDEALTPDSSRFWPAETYAPGRSQPSFDKQFVRNWLVSEGWAGEGEPPVLPPDIVEGTIERYREAFEKLTTVSIENYLERWNLTNPEIPV